MRLNPWRTIRNLTEELDEYKAQEKNLRQAIAHCHTDMKRQTVEHNELRDQNFHLKMEVERLNSRLINAVFRDPETGRLLPKGTVPA